MQSMYFLKATTKIILILVLGGMGVVVVYVCVSSAKIRIVLIVAFRKYILCMVNLTFPTPPRGNTKFCDIIALHGPSVKSALRPGGK